MQHKRLLPKYITAATALVVFAIAVSPTAAAEDEPGGIITLTVENDVFTGSDDRFTNGINATWTSRNLNAYDEDSFVRQWGDFWSFAPGASRQNTQTYVAWSLSQEMHTPEDISAPIPDPNDQPYAGLLLLDNTLYTIGENWGQAWNLQIGVVGPASGAGETQEWFHDLIGAEDPQGWDTQIQNEPIINLGYTTGFRWIDRPSVFGGDLRLTPLANVELGNHFTGAGGAVLMEYGWYLPDQLSMGSLGMNLHAAHIVGAQPTERWSVATYASVGGYAIGHYLPLDGSVFRDGPSVDTDNFATQFNFGLTARRGRFAAKFAIADGASPGDNLRGDIDYGILSLSWIY